MKLIGRGLTALFLCVFLAHSVSASVFSFGELLLRPVLIKSKVIKEGISGASITSLKNSIEYSVRTIAQDHSSLKEGLETILSKASREDKDKVQRIISSLDAPTDSISGERFKAIANDLAYLASAYGTHADDILSCSICKTDQLASLGYKSKIVKVSDPSLKRMMVRLPKGQDALNRYIGQKSRSLKVKDVTRYLDKADRKTLALFLSFNNRGAKKEYAEFYQAVAKYSSDSNGRALFAGPGSSNHLWKVIDGKFSPEKAQKLATAINEASRVPASKREDAFFDQLYKVSDKTPETKAKIEELKKKKCLFK